MSRFGRELDVIQSAATVLMASQRLARPITVKNRPGSGALGGSAPSSRERRKIRVETGWTPEVCFEECLEELIHEYSLPR